MTLTKDPLQRPARAPFRLSRTLGTLALCCLLSAGSFGISQSAYADNHANAQGQTTVTTAQLGWLSGRWIGPLGEQQLEENWTVPDGGSIAAFVRFIGANGLNMLELVSITDSAEGLELRIAQWSPTLQPRAPQPQLMQLKSASERSLIFGAVSAGGLAQLQYESPDENTLNVIVTLTEGTLLKIELQRQR